MTRLTITATILSLLAAPAFAQDAAEEPEFDASVLETCLENASQRQQQGEDADRQSCIGAASDQCMEGPGGYSTVGMSTCMGEELDLWDAKLNEAYRTLSEKARATDKDMGELGSAAEKQEPLLQDMQRKWIAFRDAACSFERSQWGGGSGGGPASVTCMMDVTAQQYIRLQGYIDAAN